MVVAGLIGLGTIIFYQEIQLGRITRVLSTISTRLQDWSKKQDVSSVMEDGYQVITQKTVNWQGDAVQFTHRCKGQVKAGNLFGGAELPISYCIGENQLVFTDAASNMKIIQTDTIAADIEAPVLIGADLVPGSKTGAVLISYAVEACAVGGEDCGVGIPSHYVRWVYNLADQSLRGVGQFPRWGWPTWNPSGTKAIFIPDTCGGAGCDVAPLIGYNLLTDKAADVTSLAAAGCEHEGCRAQEAGTGDPIQQWGPVTWKDETTFSVVLFHADDTKEQVMGRF